MDYGVQIHRNIGNEFNLHRHLLTLLEIFTVDLTHR